MSSGGRSVAGSLPTPRLGRHCLPHPALEFRGVVRLAGLRLVQGLHPHGQGAYKIVGCALHKGKSPETLLLQGFGYRLYAWQIGGFIWLPALANQPAF